MLRILLCAAALGVSFTAHAAGPMVSPAQSLAATCFNCHGPKGVSEAPIPGLAGRSAESTIAAMEEYRSGKRPGTIMPQIAKGYTPEQIKLIADYFAQQKP